MGKTPGERRAALENNKDTGQGTKRANAAPNHEAEGKTCRVRVALDETMTADKDAPQQQRRPDRHGPCNESAEGPVRYGSDCDMIQGEENE